MVEGVKPEWVWHSPAEFEWDYGGSGSAELALNILLTTSGDRDFAVQHHQAFKRQFVEKLPAEGGVIATGEVLDWIAERSSAPEGAANGQDC